ncbi:unnamed protein product [Dracunculus medinensis]|uniref:Fcf2 pre-rRNA processing C-terminal domain-containing protein n=1 Tax=Dracunculus medinensis TaxID=318479 RepID=A0A3P7TCA6_DRAME|nr:unnamed protein product [Dracunculus medinensis]
MLEKSIIRPGFEKILGEGFVPLSAGAAKRMRKIERERTKGVSWFNMPATELTEERRRDLELLQMRDTIDEKARYRKSDHSTLPKFFQVGTIIESKADFYSSRIPKKARKRTIAEELLADIEFQARQKKKFNEIKSLEAIKKKGSFRHSWYPKKKRMRRKNI